MADPNLSKLLNWSLRNSTPSDPSDPTTTSDTTSNGTQDLKPLDPELMKHLFGGPSDADLMKSSMASILDTSNSLENRLVAFENLEQLIEGIDNANNIQPLGLWPALIGLLSAPNTSQSQGEQSGSTGSQTQESSSDDSDAQLQIMAAWTIGTAVQNNISAQVSAFEHGAIEPLVQLTKNEKTRRKAVYALSSEVRNYQVGLDRLLEVLGEKSLKADDMEGIDGLMERLRTGR